MEGNIKKPEESITYPVLEQRIMSNGHGYTDCFYKLSEGDYDSFSDEIPYVSAVRGFMENEKTSKDRIIIISDEKKFALKAAALITAKSAVKDFAPMPVVGGTAFAPFVSEDDDDEITADELDDYMNSDDEDYYEEYDEDEEEDYYEEYDEDEYDEDDNRLKPFTTIKPGPIADRYMRVIDYSGIIPCDDGNTIQNPYHQRFLGFPGLPTGGILVTGLENPVDREKKLESLHAVQSRGIPFGAVRVIILIPDSEKSSLWVKNLIRTWGYSVLWLPNCSEYMKKFADGIEKEPYLNIPDFVIKPEIPTTQEILNTMITDLGSDYAEEDYIWYLANRNPLGFHRVPALQQLSFMVGLEDAKNAAIEFDALAREKVINPKLTGVRQHMLFYGDPGTGKTTVGQLMAGILAESGNSKAVFVTASRSDLIGKYVGQTAPKVAERFKEARGGILFVDEAGFFLSDEKGQGYTTEAIREFVRYMELYDDVTVIFALYKDEVEDFLALDAGLRSRIGRLVEFEGYTDDELIDIAEHIAFGQGYSIADDSRDIIIQYMDELRSDSKNSFGNARDIRKVVESSIIMYAVRMKNKGYEFDKSDLDDSGFDEEDFEELDGYLTVEDIRKGIERLKNN